MVVLFALILLTRWAAHEAWRDTHRCGLVFGAIVGNMGAGYLGYLWNTTPVDF